MFFITYMPLVLCTSICMALHFISIECNYFYVMYMVLLNIIKPWNIIKNRLTDNTWKIRCRSVLLLCRHWLMGAQSRAYCDVMHYKWPYHRHSSDGVCICDKELYLGSWLWQQWRNPRRKSEESLCFVIVLSLHGHPYSKSIRPT